MTEGRATNRESSGATAGATAVRGAAGASEAEKGSASTPTGAADEAPASAPPAGAVPFGVATLATGGGGVLRPNGSASAPAAAPPGVAREPTRGAAFDVSVRPGGATTAPIWLVRIAAPPGIELDRASALTAPGIGVGRMSRVRTDLRDHRGEERGERLQRLPLVEAFAPDERLTIDRARKRFLANDGEPHRAERNAADPHVPIFGGRCRRRDGGRRGGHGARKASREAARRCDEVHGRGR